MSVATIAAAVQTTLDGIAGVHNVEIEEPIALDADEAVAERMYGERVHFWSVKVDTLEPTGGVGFLEMRHRVSVDGYLGVARDDPWDGEASDETAKALHALVVSTFADADNRTLGGVVIDGFAYVPGPITTVDRTVGRESFPCHRLPFTFTVSEDA